MFLSDKVCRAAALWIFVCLASASVARAQALPAPWVSQDIGTPLIAGAATFSAPASFTLKSAGADIWGTSDQFHFVYLAIPGDVDIRARLDSISPTSTWAKAGLMIRSSLSAGSAHAFALVSYSKGLAFQRRPVTGGSSLHTAGEMAQAPRWVRLVRIGNLVTSFSSADGVTWTTMGSETLQLGVTAYVGVAASSGNIFAAGTAVVSQVSLERPSNLPSGQASADVGSPALHGSTSYGSGAYTIIAGGVDIWGTADQFHYLYQQASGDIDVKVRIASLSYADVWSKTGVMIRASLAADSAHAMAVVSAGKGYAFQRRNTDGGLSVNTSGGGGVAPGWVRLKRSGTLVTAYRSADGVNWTVIGSDSVVTGDQVYVGIAATSHTATATTTVRADNFSVIQTTPANQPPVVSLATNGTAFTAPAGVMLTASASDPENQLARVEFYTGTTLLGTDTAAPFTFTWSNVAAGTYSLRAVAYDTAGASGSSATAAITVSAATNTPPTVTLTAPTNGASYVAPASIALTASAADSNGSVARVEFYAGTTLLNSDTTAPYAFTVSNVTAGTYAIRAVAYDNAGASTASATATITVGAAAPTAVVFTASADHATVTSYLLEIFANGANPATAAPVRSASLGKPSPATNGDITVNQATLFGGLASGTYVATVSAINAGGKTRSTVVTFTR